MPSKSQKQARFMAAAAHNPDFAKRVGIKQSVASDFNEADTGTKLLSDAMRGRKKRKAKGGRSEYAVGGLAAVTAPQGAGAGTRIAGRSPNGALRAADDVLKRSSRAVQAIRNRSMRNRMM